MHGDTPGIQERGGCSKLGFKAGDIGQKIGSK